MLENEQIIASAIQQLARSAAAVGQQADVGGVEVAGTIVSFLAANPEYTGAFFEHGSVLDLPQDWLERGCLTWEEDGKILSPADAGQSPVAGHLAQIGQANG